MNTEEILRYVPEASSVARFVPLLMLVLFLLMWRLRWRDYRLPVVLSRRSAQRPAAELSKPAYAGAPRVSVVIPCCNAADLLRENLPAIMAQRFEGFEVIVVNEASTDETRELLDYLSGQYANLRHTFVPASSHYIDRRKLAVTLGVRAARAPWVVLTDADCRPAGDEWLARMAERFTDDVDFVLDYANYEADDDTHRIRRARCERLRRQLMRYRAAWGTWLARRKHAGMPSGKAFGGDGSNLAVRKEWFMACGGFESTLTVPCGSDDLLVDALSKKGRTDIVTDSAASVFQSLPDDALARTMRIVRRETIRHFGHRGRMFLWRDGAASLCAWLFLVSTLAYVAVRGVEAALLTPYTVYNGVADGGAFLLLVLTIFLPGHYLRRAARVLGDEPVGRRTLYGNSLMQPWRNVSLRMARFRRRHSFVRR